MFARYTPPPLAGADQRNFHNICKISLESPTEGQNSSETVTILSLFEPLGNQGRVSGRVDDCGGPICTRVGKGVAPISRLFTRGEGDPMMNITQFLDASQH